MTANQNFDADADVDVDVVQRFEKFARKTKRASDKVAKKRPKSWRQISPKRIQWLVEHKIRPFVKG